MTAPANEPTLAFETFSMKIGVTADDPAIIARLDGLAPAGARPVDIDDVECRFEFTTTDQGRYNIRFRVREGKTLTERDPSAWVAGDADLDLAIDSLDAHVQSYIGLHAPDHIFIRAGVVGYRGHAILVLGGRVSGRSRLARELVRTGATGYSEDFAPIDRNGLVHPYFRPEVPGIRAGAEPDRITGAGSEDLEPLPIGGVVTTTYLPGADWDPRYKTRGEAVLMLVEHAEPGSERGQETFEMITRAVGEDVVAIQSDRGEAEAVAPLLLSDVERARSEAA